MPGMNLTTVCSTLAENAFVSLGPLGGGAPMKREFDEDTEEEDMTRGEEYLDEEEIEEDLQLLRKAKKGGKGKMKPLLKFFIGHCVSGQLDKVHIVKALCKNETSLRTMGVLPIEMNCQNYSSATTVGAMARVFSIPQSTAAVLKCITFTCDAGSVDMPVITESDNCENYVPCESLKGGKGKGKGKDKGKAKGKGKGGKKGKGL